MGEGWFKIVLAGKTLKIIFRKEFIWVSGGAANVMT
jgi:hypothetical protein